MSCPGFPKQTPRYASYAGAVAAACLCSSTLAYWPYKCEPPLSDGPAFPSCGPDAPGAWTRTSDPIDAYGGHKVERVVDLSIQLSGGAFEILREYSSHKSNDVAYRGTLSTWMLSPFVSTYECGFDHIHVTSGSATFLTTLEEQPPLGSGIWSAGGPTAQTIEAEVAQVSMNGANNPTWRRVYTLKEPGAWRKMFYRTTEHANDSVPPGQQLDTTGLSGSNHSLDGMLAQERDAYGNTRSYEYQLLPNGVFDNVRRATLSTIWCRTPADGDDVLQAKIVFEWAQPFETLVYYRLKRIRVLRPTDPPSEDPNDLQEVQRVTYYYLNDFIPYLSTIDADVGRFDDSGGSEPAFADLVQVCYYERVDGDASVAVTTEALGDSLGYAASEHIRQYRYHDGEGRTFGPSLPPSNALLSLLDGEYPTEIDSSGEVGSFVEPTEIPAQGRVHQLKMVVEPEQMERFSQMWIDAGLTSMPTADLATYLLSKPDGHVLISQPTVQLADLASNFISYDVEDEEYRIQKQLVRGGGCGCGGSAGDRLIEYEFVKAPLESDYVQTTLLRERHRETVISFHEDAYAEWGYDFAATGIFEFELPHLASATPYLVNAVYGEPEASGEPDRWVTHYVYDRSPETDTQRTLVRVMTPAAAALYTPGDTEEPPFYEANEDAGLVYGYGYTADNRRSESRVRAGAGEGASDLEVGAALASFVALQRTQYGTGTGPGSGGYFHNAASIEGFIVAPSVEPPPTSEQIRALVYGHYDVDGDANPDEAIAWVRSATAVEPESENGVGGVAYSFEVYDRRGQSVWSIAADGARARREYNDLGHLVRETRNAASSSSDFDDFPGLNSALSAVGLSADRNADGGSLTTEYRCDLLGRVVEVTQPGGVKSYVRRTMRAVPSAFTGFVSLSRAMYSEAHVPHELESGAFAGPVRISWMTAADRVVATSTYALEEESVEYSESTSLEDHPIESITLGQELSRTIHERDLHGRDLREHFWHRVSLNDYYTRENAYDARGRIVQTTEPNGAITRYTYDINDRVIALEIGTDASGSGNMALVTEYFYDHFMDGGQPQQGVGNGNLTLVRQHVGPSEHRDTEYLYDYRDRLVWTINPLAPHAWQGYDNVDRVIETAMATAAPTSGVDPPDAEDRIDLRRTLFNRRGMTHRTQTAIDPTDTEPEFLESNTWFDIMGRTIARWDPSGPAMKTTYDGLGRIKATYVTDRGGDALPGASGNHADAASVAGDVILEQTLTRYIPDFDSQEERMRGGGQADLSISMRRTHDATASQTGDLATSSLVPSTSVITTFGASYYDDAARPICTVDLGTDKSGFEYNDASQYTDGLGPDVDQSSPPSQSTAQMLVRTTEYDARGLRHIETDPAGVKTRFVYDDLGRQVATIENYDDASAVWSDTEGRMVASGVGPGADEDRVTSLVLDGAGNILKRVAHIPDGQGEAVQVTAYEYDPPGSGASPASPLSSTLHSRDLVYRIRYPDRTTGEAGTSAADVVDYAFNLQGETIALVDQNGTRHDYEYDAAGRTTLDEATLPQGSSIDGSITAIEYIYEAGTGRRESINSLNGQAQIVNGVQYTYTPRGLVVDVWQNPAGEVDDTGATATSLRVSTEYSEIAPSGSGGNFSRRSALKYPTDPPMPNPLGDPPYPVRTTVVHDYQGLGGVNNRISRLYELQWEGPAFFESAAYEYLGHHSPVKKTYAAPAIRLDRAIDPVAATTTAGVYHGIDRFGRLKHQLWVDQSWSSTKPAIVDLEYAYDAASNITGRWDRRAGDRSARPDRDEQYAYDALHRLSQADRGERDHAANPPTFASGGDRGQQWSLDHLGNWLGFITDLSGDGAYGSGDMQETGEFNMVNEAAAFGEAFGSPAAAPAYTHDDAGNLVSRQIRPLGGTGTASVMEFTYDAWNRLTRVKIGLPSQTVDRAVYAYNGLHHRVRRWADSDWNASLDEQSLFYYDDAWRLLEEQVEEGWSGSPAPGSPGGTFAPDLTRQYIWGPHYVDELVAVLADTDNDGVVGDWSSGSGSGAEEHYALTDRRYDVVALLDHLGDLKERVRFTAYGVARNQPFGDVNGDGEVDHTKSAPDNAAMIPASWSDPQYDPDGDLDRDGDVDSTDAALAAAVGFVAALPEGMVSRLGSIVGSTGAIYDPAVDLLLHRNRWRDAKNGRWLTRDPAGYVDGMSLYQYAQSRSLLMTDANGLFVAGLNHIVPRFLGGRPSGRSIAFSADDHGAFHRALYELGFPANDPDYAAAKFASLDEDAKRSVLLSAYSRTGAVDVIEDLDRDIVEELKEGNWRAGNRSHEPPLGTRTTRPVSYYDSWHGGGIAPAPAPTPTPPKKKRPPGTPRPPGGTPPSVAGAVGVSILTTYFTVLQLADMASAGQPCHEAFRQISFIGNGRCSSHLLDESVESCGFDFLTSGLPHTMAYGYWHLLHSLHEDVAPLCGLESHGPSCHE